MLKKKPKSLDSQFLIRVIRNEVSPEEKEFFYAWLSESNQNKEIFGNLVLVWDLGEGSKVSPFPDPDKQWAVIQQKIVADSQLPDAPVQKLIASNLPTEQVAVESNNSVMRNFRWISGIAAVIVITIGLAFLFKWYRSEQQVQSLSITEKANTEYHELITQKGERKTMALYDGSIVYLNSDSKLTYPKSFSESSREVEITGEAYFSVVPDRVREFKVISGGMVTSVTGTEFNVKYRNGKVNVVVAKGSVTTYSKNSTAGFKLHKGEMISFTENRGFNSPTMVNLEHVLAWRWNKLSFTRTPLKDVMAEIERYYNLPVVFQNDSVRNKKFTGTFKADSLSQLFSIISLTMDVKINYNGSKLIIN